MITVISARLTSSHRFICFVLVLTTLCVAGCDVPANHPPLPSVTVPQEVDIKELPTAAPLVSPTRTFQATSTPTFTPTFTPTQTALVDAIPIIENPLSALDTGLYMVYLQGCSFVVRSLDGQVLGRLNIPEVYRFSAAYDPVTKRIAFANTSYRISVYEMENGKITQIDHPSEIWTAGGPEWAPDGEQIAYVGYVYNGEGDANIYITNLSSATTFRLTPWEDSEGAPTWSMDGEWFAYGRRTIRVQEPSQKVVLVKAACAAPDASCSENFLPLEQLGITWSAFPVFDPQASQLAFACTRHNQDGICLYQIDSKKLVKFVRVEQPYIYGLRWSPDGKYIAFTSSNDIYLLTVSTGQQVNVTNTQDKYEAFSFWFEK